MILRVFLCFNLALFTVALYCLCMYNDTPAPIVTSMALASAIILNLENLLISITRGNGK